MGINQEQILTIANETEMTTPNNSILQLNSFGSVRNIMQRLITLSELTMNI